jgi:hypothetical protein
LKIVRLPERLRSKSFRPAAAGEKSIQTSP